MNSMGKILTIVITMLLLSINSQAATVSLSPPLTNISLNDSFILNLIGSNFDSGILDGGGINIDFNPAIINATKVTINTADWEFFSTEGNIDNLTGTIKGLSFNSFQSRTGDLNFATIEFISVGLGSSSLGLSEYNNNPFASSGNLYTNITLEQSASVSIQPIPLPASIWLLLSGLALFTAKQRRTMKF